MRARYQRGYLRLRPSKDGTGLLGISLVGHGTEWTSGTPQSGHRKRPAIPQCRRRMASQQRPAGVHQRSSKPAARTIGHGCRFGRPLHEDGTRRRSDGSREVTRHKDCVQRFYCEVGQTSLGQLEHPGRPHSGCRTLASSTDAGRR